MERGSVLLKDISPPSGWEAALSNAEVEERAELYFCSPSGSPWHGTRWTLLGWWQMKCALRIWLSCSSARGRTLPGSRGLVGMCLIFTCLGRACASSPSRPCRNKHSRHATIFLAEEEVTVRVAWLTHLAPGLWGCYRGVHTCFTCHEIYSSPPLL